MIGGPQAATGLPDARPGRPPPAAGAAGRVPGADPARSGTISGMTDGEPLPGYVLFEALDGSIQQARADRFLSRKTAARLADGRTVTVATALLEGKTARGRLGQCEVCSRLFPKDPADPLNRYLFGEDTGPSSPYRDAESDRCAEHGGAPLQP